VPARPLAGRQAARGRGRARGRRVARAEPHAGRARGLRRRLARLGQPRSGRPREERDRVGEAAAHRHPRPRAPREGSAVLMKKPLVLIVEDDNDLGSSIVDYLKEEGLDAKLARDGDQAMRMVDSLSPSVVVLDLMMPRRDGFSVLRELRSDGRIAGLPVIVVTAIFGLSERLYATELGAADYITKPFKLDELLQRIVGLLPADQRPGAPFSPSPDVPKTP